MAVFIALVPADSVRAQLDPTGDPTFKAVAEACAPVLRFAEGEQYFPTMPALLALELSQGRVVEDALAEAAERGLRGQPVPSLGPADRVPWVRRYQGLSDYFVVTGTFEDEDRFYRLAFDRLGGDPPAEPGWSHALAVVLYDVRELSDDTVEAFLSDLRIDPQAERRYLEQLADFGDRGYRAVMIDYWLYYVRDTGLEGHPHDIERVTVVTDGSSQVLIGSAHSKNEPNNVAVAATESCWTSLSHPTFLVELGGHGSAPDLNGNGDFALGEDLNWHAQDAWGLRDAPALTGQAWGGQYQPFMTLDHDSPSARCYAPPRVVDATVIAQMCGQAEPLRYALVPVSAVEEMLTRAADPGAATDDVLMAADAVAAHFAHLLPPSNTPDEYKASLVDGIRRYAARMDADGKHGKLAVELFSPWLHDEFRDGPDDRLLPFLHRRAWALGLTGEWYHETSWSIGGTVLVPVHEAVPISLNGFFLLQLQWVRWLRGDAENPAPTYENSWAIEANYRSAYRGSSWWLGVGYMDGPDPVPGTDRSPLSVRVGVSFPLCLPSWNCYEGPMPLRFSPHVRFHFVGAPELGLRLDLW